MTILLALWPSLAGGRPQVQLLVPDISVIVDTNLLLSSNDEEADRNKVVPRCVELSLQGFLHPSIRGDCFLALHRHGEHMEPEICEGFITFSHLGKGFSARVGKIHVPFGKINPIHQHHRPYADQPAVITRLFGHHGLVGEGVELSYLLPTERFVQISLATWEVRHEHHHNHHHHHTLGLHEVVDTARVWTGWAPDERSQIELGLSAARKRNGSAHALGLDLTYKRWPHAFKRTVLQAEFIAGKARQGNERHPYGFYLYGGYQLNQYWEVGGRYDWTKRVEGGHESCLSAIVTRRLTETTFVRLQVRYNSLPDKDFLDLFVNFTWGMGPHAHPLE